MSTVSHRESEQVEGVNASGRQPVVFIHGLWLLHSSWDAWRDLFEEHGYATVAADWPDDPDTYDEAHARPEVFARKSVGQAADHLVEVVNRLERRPILVGHSIGGLLAQIIAGRGLALATVAIDPPPSRGVLPVALSALKASFPVLRNPANYRRAVRLTFEEFRYGFANAVSEEEARYLYETFHVPAPGRPVFQVATANLDFRTEARADKHHPDRGPMLLVSGAEDHIVPSRLTHAAYRLQRANPHPTEFVEIPDVGHSLVIDSHWRAVAEAALGFLARHAPAG